MAGQLLAAVATSLEGPDRLLAHYEALVKDFPASPQTPAALLRAGVIEASALNNEKASRG